MNQSLTRNWRGMGSALLVLGLSLVFLPWAYRYDPQGRAVPVLVGWLTLGLAALDVITQTNTRIGRTLAQMLSGRPLDAQAEVEDHALRPQIVAMLWLVGFFAGAILVGFLITIPIYVISFMRYQGRKPLLPCAVSAVAVTTIMWIVFEVLLKYELYKGLIFEN